MGLAPKTVDLVARAEEAIEELRSRAEDQGIHLQLRTEDSAASAEANGGGVQIVMRSLLPNAVRHTGDGGHVWIRVRREAERAVLEIADTGIEMEPEIAGTLFEPFRQASEGMA